MRILLIDHNKLLHECFKKNLTRLINSTVSRSNELFWHLSLDIAFSDQECLNLVKQSLLDNNPYAIAIVGLNEIKVITQIFQIEPNIQVIFFLFPLDFKQIKVLENIQYTERWVILKKPFDIIEFRQLIENLYNKWTLLLNLRNRISEETKELNNKLAKIRKIAYYDFLTKLPNSYFFKKLLEISIKEAEQNKNLLGLLFIDIDNFKKVNDTYGHDIGDELLRKVVFRLNGTLRKSDLSARLGGDEFTILVKDFIDQNALYKIAKRILNSICCSPYKIKYINLNITVSVGIAIYPVSAATVEDLIKNADTAMYQAKKNGKNQIALYKKFTNFLIHPILHS